MREFIFGIMGGTALLMYGVGIAVLILPWFVQFIQAVTACIQPNADMSVLIANSHAFFNLLSAVIFLPITKYYVKFIEYIV